MSRARELAKLGNTDAIGIDGVDLRAGSVSKGTTLDVASNVNVSGVITATNFIGNASGLTGLTAVGFGVTILRSDNSIGAAKQINFDNTFSISALSSGITTVTSGVTTADPRSSSLVVAGVSTLSGQVSASNLSVVGVVTSTSFTKSGGTSSQYLMADGSVSTDVSTSGLVVAGISTLQNITAGVVTSTSFIKSGGTSSQYLMADGSVSASGAGAGSTADVSTSGLVVAGVSTLAGATFSGVSTFNSNVELPNNQHLILGDGLDDSGKIKLYNGSNEPFEIFGSSKETYIRNTGSNANGINISANAGVTLSGNGTGTFSVYADTDGTAKLYSTGTQERLKTDPGGVIITGVATATGLSVTGQSTLSNLNVSSGIATVAGQTNLANLNITGVSTFNGKTRLLDDVEFHVGTNGIAGDYKFYRDSGNTLNILYEDISGAEARFIGNVSGTGNESNFTFLKHTSELAKFTQNGIKLYSGGNLKFETSAGGIIVTGVTTTSGVRVSGSAGIITATGHVDSTIVTYYGDSSYSAAGRWVLGADGSNHYTFTGPGLGHSTQNDPALYLKRGQTYMFENKMGAHPFRIQSTANGSAGTAWNVGVTNNDVSNGVLIFEVPFVTPNTLYYQCTAHANMGGVINIA